MPIGYPFISNNNLIFHLTRLGFENIDDIMLKGIPWRDQSLK